MTPVPRGAHKPRKSPRPSVWRAAYQLDVDVHTAALNRMRWLFEEFDGDVHVAVSGGKDSTVVLELAAIVQKEYDSSRPLHLHWLDQEAEWQGTRDYMRHLKDTRPDLNIDWYQCSFRLSNNTSYEQEWGQMWDASLSDSDYVRPKEVDSIHDNPFRDREGNRIDNFHPMLEAINKRNGGAQLSGMRTEEAPSRRVGLTGAASYKWVTWCRAEPSYVVFHPIYDWTWRDVWKAIHDHGWAYNSIYDSMFRLGVPIPRMRVSSLTHTEAMRSLSYVQEIEPETWVALTRRFRGINAYSHSGRAILDEYLDQRPYMFDTWAEYVEYLIEHLVPAEHRPSFQMWRTILRTELPYLTEERIDRQVLKAVLRMDYYEEFSTLGKFLLAGQNRAKRWEAQHGPLRPRTWERIPK